MSNGSDNKKTSWLPSFGRKNIFRNDSDSGRELPDPNSFTLKADSISAAESDQLNPSALTDTISPEPASETPPLTDPANATSATLPKPLLATTASELDSDSKTTQDINNHLLGSTSTHASSKSPRSKKPLYLAAGVVAAIILLIFSVIGIYSTFFNKNSADIKSDSTLRHTRDGEILSADSIPSKPSSEITDEELANNDYAWYKLDSEIESKFSEIAEEIDERLMSNEIDLTAAKSEYQNNVKSRNENSEKAYFLLREANLISYAIDQEDNDSIVLIGELALQAEELYPTIASAEALAEWEYYYGSEEKSNNYYQIMYQRQLDAGYINVTYPEADVNPESEDKTDETDEKESEDISEDEE